MAQFRELWLYEVGGKSIENKIPDYKTGSNSRELWLYGGGAKSIKNKVPNYKTYPTQEDYSFTEAEQSQLETKYLITKPEPTQRFMVVGSKQRQLETIYPITKPEPCQT